MGQKAKKNYRTKAQAADKADTRGAVQEEFIWENAGIGAKFLGMWMTEEGRGNPDNVKTRMDASSELRRSSGLPSVVVMVRTHAPDEALVEGTEDG